MIEEWRLLDMYPEYEVSNLGNVRSIDRDYVDSWGRHYHKKGQQIKTVVQITKGNYPQVMVGLVSGKKAHRLIVARLIAMAFVPNPDNLPQVNHINENSMDNRAENLEWCDCKYNINYGTYIERRSKSKSRAVDVFDLDGNFIETVASGVEASKKYNVSRGSISSCCHGNGKSVKGYCFKFH